MTKSPKRKTDPTVVNSDIIFDLTQVAKLMKSLKTMYDHKQKLKRVQMRDRASQHQKEMSKIEARKAKKQKEVKKQIFRVLGQIEKKKNKSRH